jgi:hypothetical protein
VERGPHERPLDDPPLPERAIQLRGDEAVEARGQRDVRRGWLLRLERDESLDGVDDIQPLPAQEPLAGKRRAVELGGGQRSVGHRSRSYRRSMSDFVRSCRGSGLPGRSRGGYARREVRSLHREEPVTLVILFKALHVLSAFALVSLLVASDLWFQRVAMTGDAGATARLGTLIRKRNMVEGLIFEITIVFGVATALLGGFNLLASWLVLAYVMAVAITVVTFRWNAPAFTAVIAAAEAGDEAAVRAAASAPRRRYALSAVVALFALLIADMVIKPTFW